MKRVLLLNPPGRRPYIRDNYCSYSSKANYFWEPIDLLIQSARLRDAFDLAVLDAIAEQRGPDDVCARVRDGKYDAIVSLTGSVSLEEDRALFARIKRETGALIAVSGDLCLTSPVGALEQLPDVDVAIADYTTPELAAYLVEGGARIYADLAYRDGERIVGPAEDAGGDGVLDYAVPRHDLFPMKRYRISTSVDRTFATCIASLGCNFNCPFCICSIMTLKLRTIDSLIAELREIRRMGVREIYFYDPNFTVKKSRCVEMLQAIIDADLGLVFSCNSHITVTEDVLDLLAAAGCHTLMFGIESASERTLKSYSKGITREKIHRTLARCRARGIRTFGYFLLGLPGETESDIRNTIDFAWSLPLSYASFNLPSPVEGTGLYDEVKAQGLLRESDGNLDRSTEVSIALPTVSDRRLLELKRLAYRRFYLRPLFLVRTIITLYPRNKWGLFLEDVWTFFRRNFI